MDNPVGKIGNVMFMGNNDHSNPGQIHLTEQLNHFQRCLGIQCARLVRQPE